MTNASKIIRLEFKANGEPFVDFLESERPLSCAEIATLERCLNDEINSRDSPVESVADAMTSAMTRFRETAGVTLRTCNAPYAYEIQI